MPFKLTVDGEELDAVLSTYTLMVYEHEFGGADLIKDIFGKVEVTNREIESAMAETDGSGELIQNDSSEDAVFVTIDYGKTNWTALTRCAWACLKAHDDSVHPFSEWAREAHELDLNEVSGAVFPEATRMFFRAGVAASA